MKLLIVAPHFPPSSMPPSQRVRLILPYLKKMGVDASVVTTNAKNRPDTNDPWMLELIGDDFELFEITTLSPKLTRRFKIGDLGIRMLPFLAPFLWFKRNKKNTDFILYLVPPWYILMIAPLTKFFKSIPYGIDFIDPWVSESDDQANWGLKKRWNHRLGIYFERLACQGASVIYSVSEGINQNLRKRYAKLGKKPMYAIPYGVEANDYKQVDAAERDSQLFQMTYVGAIWPDAFRVLEGILKALGKSDFDFRLDFVGSSYAKDPKKTKEVTEMIEQNELTQKVFEEPNRVTYKKAIELQLSADALMLFGGMQAYYAASKLFGMIASGKPFLAFLHRDSFPAQIMREINFPYLVQYSGNEGDLPIDHLQELIEVFARLKHEFNNFEPFSLNDERLAKYTAESMSASFVEPIVELLDK